MSVQQYPGAQPDVLEMVKTWLATVVPGTPLEKVDVRTEDDPGTINPPWIFLEDAGAIHDAYAPAYLPYRMSVTTYGRTHREAGEMYRALTDLLHGASNVLNPTTRVGFWSAQDETGPQPGPEGRWPARLGVVALFMPDRALP